MTFFDTLRGFATWLTAEPTPTTLSTQGEVSDLLRRFDGNRASVHRIPSVKEALGVPAIYRAASLISSTTGMLSMQGVRDGALMDSSPPLLTRPDPFHSPDEFYGGTAGDMAKYGEFVWWIASRDSDGHAAALVRVPLHELSVEDNPRNRLLPTYRWGNVISTRFSPANPSGQFVHRMFHLSDSFALRGQGPLQVCGAATSVSVEAQNWAANFYAEGGYPNINLHDPTELSADEAEDLRAAWTRTPPNTPQVTSGTLELRQVPVNSIGAQMLDARQYNNGDAARIFGIPGSLLEYQTPGSSLTYQNLEGEFTKFVRVCLQPYYLEPIEAAISDLLTRSTVARFNTEAFQRADSLTRYRVHKLAIDAGVYDQAYAQKVEGILPGDVEYAAIPPAPPQAIPTPIRASLAPEGREVRCPKGHLLAEMASPPYRFTCFRCKAQVAA